MTDNFTNNNRKNRLAVTAAIFIAAVLSGIVSASTYSVMLIAAAGACSAWLIHRENFILGIAPALPAYIGALIITRSPVAALISAAFLPLGILLSLVSGKKINRSSAMAISGGIIGAVMIAAACVKTYISQGSVGIEQIRNNFPEFFDAIADLLKGSTTITVAGKVTSYITAENVDQYVNSLIGILPGCLILISTFVSYVSSFLYRLLLRLTAKELPDDQYWKFVTSPVTSLFFLGGFIISLVSSPTGIIWFAAVNFTMMLVCEPIISGLNSITEIKIINNIPRIPVLRMLIALFSLVFGGIVVLLIYALFCGLTDSILEIFRKDNKIA